MSLQRPSLTHVPLTSLALVLVGAISQFRSHMVSITQALMPHYPNIDLFCGALSVRALFFPAVQHT